MSNEVLIYFLCYVISTPLPLLTELGVENLTSYYLDTDTVPELPKGPSFPKFNKHVDRDLASNLSARLFGQATVI